MLLKETYGFDIAHLIPKAWNEDGRFMTREN